MMINCVPEVELRIAKYICKCNSPASDFLFEKSKPDLYFFFLCLGILTVFELLNNIFFHSPALVQRQDGGNHFGLVPVLPEITVFDPCSILPWIPQEMPIKSHWNVIFSL